PATPELPICNLRLCEPRTMIRAQQSSMRSGNPVLSDSTFTDVAQRGYGRPMTLNGVIHRSVLLFLLVVGSATGIWAYSSSVPSIVYPAVMIGALGGFAVALATSFKRNWAP